jgi:transitional endoplasmic reticulum ATPase
MDGLESRGHGLLVVGATNHPNALDAALRRPGRFDRELRIEPPTVEQREDILRFYTRDMPLDPLIDLNALAQRCIGFVGADLAALVREAATHALRQYTKKQRESTSSAAAQQAPMLPSISWSDFEAALLVTPASSLRGNGALARKSTTSFAQIGGLSRVKQQLRQALEWPLQFGETFRVLGLRPPRGIVLYGPPGCAKTTLVRAMAASTSAAFLPLDTARLYSCFVGEAERILRALFSRARANRPCVLFLDEIDAMVHKRGMTSSSASASGAQSLEARILSTLLNEMDGMQSSAGVLVVAATNRLDLLDEALLRPGRFDNIVYVPPPDAQARTDILRVHAARMLGLQQKEEEEEEEEEEEAPPADADAPVAADARQGQPQPQQLQQKVPAIVSAEQSELEKDLAALGAELEGYTGADIANLCREAALTVLRNDITNTRVVSFTPFTPFLHLSREARLRCSSNCT